MKKARKSKPLTAYPLFPAFVALWFAALLGLSSLAVGVANLERAVSLAQLQQILPQAAPPLGMTARALIAAAMAALGGMIGFAFAWLLVRRSRPKSRKPAPPVAVRARDTHPDAPVRRPISAHEEFGVAEIDGEAVRDMAALRASASLARDESDLALPAFIADDLPEEPKTEAVFGLPVGEAAKRISSTDLDGLSPVELLERLAMAMQHRLDRRAAAAGVEPGRLAASDEVAILPAPASSDGQEGDETEKALRDALSALQRMSRTG